MTQNPTTPEELPDSPLIQALLKFTSCIGNALPDICSYGLTTGEFYVPFMPADDEDCDEDDGKAKSNGRRPVESKEDV